MKYCITSILFLCTTAIHGLNLPEIDTHTTIKLIAEIDKAILHHALYDTEQSIPPPLKLSYETVTTCNDYVKKNHVHNHAILNVIGQTLGCTITDEPITIAQKLAQLLLFKNHQPIHTLYTLTQLTLALSQKTPFTENERVDWGKKNYPNYIQEEATRVFNSVHKALEQFMEKKSKTSFLLWFGISIGIAVGCTISYLCIKSFLQQQASAARDAQSLQTLHEELINVQHDITRISTRLNSSDQHINTIADNITTAHENITTLTSEMGMLDTRIRDAHGTALERATRVLEATDSIQKNINANISAIRTELSKQDTKFTSVLTLLCDRIANTTNASTSIIPVHNQTKSPIQRVTENTLHLAALCNLNKNVLTQPHTVTAVLRSL